MLGASIVTKLCDAVLPRMKSANTFLDAARMKHGNRSISSATLGELKSMFNDQLNDISLPKAGEDFDHAVFQTAPRVDLTKMRMDIAVALATAKSMKHEKARTAFIEALLDISNTRDDLEDHVRTRLNALNAVPEGDRTQVQHNERLKLLHWLDGPGDEGATDGERLADVHGKRFKVSIDVTTMGLGEAIWLKLGNTSVSHRTLAKIDQLFFNHYDIPKNPKLKAFTVTDFPGFPSEDCSLADAASTLEHLTDMVVASGMGDAGKERMLGELGYFSAHVEKAQACWLSVYEATCDSTSPADVTLNERAAAWLGIESEDDNRSISSKDSYSTEHSYGIKDSVSERFTGLYDPDEGNYPAYAKEWGGSGVLLGRHDSTESIGNADDLLSDYESSTYQGNDPGGLSIRQVSMRSYSEDDSYDGVSLESGSDTDSSTSLGLPLPISPITDTHSMDTASSYPYSDFEMRSTAGDRVIDSRDLQDTQSLRAHAERMISELFGKHPIPAERLNAFNAWQGEDFPIDPYSFGDYDETRLDPKLTARMARLAIGM